MEDSLASDAPATRRPEWAAAVVLIVVTSSVPLAQGVWELARGERPQCLDLLLRPPSEQRLRDFESDLEDHSWLTRFVRPQLQHVRYTVLHDPPAKLVAGRAGWLFYEPSVDYLIQRTAAADQPNSGPRAALRAIHSFADQLAQRDVWLVVVVVPGKPTVYPDRLSGRFPAGHAVASPTEPFVAELRRTGIEVIDLAERFREIGRENTGLANRLYLDRDTHWTGYGARLAARAVADRILQLGWLAQGQEMYFTKRVPVSRMADLVKMMRSDRSLPSAEVDAWQVHREDGQLYQDDPESSVLVLGDSFARIYQTDAPRSAGFVAHLAHQLSTPLTSIVNDGGASTLVRQQLARNSQLLEGKRLVIWEFVERDLRYGLEGWQDVKLPEPER